MSNIYNWDVIAANNANSDSAIDWSEGMSPANVNDSARVMMGRVKELLIDLGGSIVATGTANVISVTTQSAFTTLANGRMLSFRSIAGNTQAATLNVNATGAKPILKATGSGIVALAGREMQAGGMYTVQYSTALNSGNGAWLLLNPAAVSTPAGIVADFMGTTIPDGWLLCYGQAISRTTYADLFAAVGTFYGAGDGSTTFNLPDFRGRVGAGQDDMGGSNSARLSGYYGSVAQALGGTLGASNHVLTAAQMPAHRHQGNTDSAGTHSHTASFPASGSVSSGGAPILGPQTGTFSFSTDSAGAHTHSFSTDFRGSDQAHPNAQPTIITLKIIKT
ncbi:putative tail collar domain-containing protein [Microcystis phage Mae-JY35]